MNKLKLPKKAKVEAEADTAESDTPKPLKTKRQRGPKPAAIPSSWQIFKASVTEFLSDWRPYTKIIGLGAVLIGALTFANTAASSTNSTSSDPTTAAYVSVFTMVLNITVIWCIDYRYKHKKLPDIRTAYYDASGSIIRFLLTFLRLLLTLIPAAIGSSIYQFLGSELVSYNDLNSVQATFVLIFAGLLWLPTLYWLTRRTLALFIVIAEGSYPGQAWKRAQAISARRFWVLARHLALFVVFGFIVAIPSMLVLYIVSLFGQSLLADILFQITATLTILPIGYTYMYKLYRALDDTTPRPEAEMKAEVA